MAVNTLPEIPESFTAGDTVRFSVSDSSYPATAWTLKFLIRANSIFAVDGAPSGDGFIVTIPAETTSRIEPGTCDYSLAFTETATGERATPTRGLIRVDPNPNAELSESIAAVTLEAMQNALKKLSAGSNQSVSFNGQSYTKKNLLELQQAIAAQQEIVDREAARLLPLNRIKGIGVRFA